MTAKNLSRREFIRVSGITLGAVAVIGAGSGCAAREPETPETEVETPSFTYGNETNMNPRILIAYATRKGSTVGVADTIGQTLAQRGYGVDIKPIKDNPSPDGYQAVVIGSAIKGAQWLPEAVEYVKNHQQALTQAQVALFCVHIMNLGDDDRSKKNRLAYLNSVRSLVTPIDEAYFAGVGMNPEEETAIVRWVYRTFKIGGEGDCRDWDQIRAWANGMPV